MEKKSKKAIERRKREKKKKKKRYKYIPPKVNPAATPGGKQ